MTLAKGWDANEDHPPPLYIGAMIKSWKGEMVFSNLYPANPADPVIRVLYPYPAFRGLYKRMTDYKLQTLA